MSTQQECRLLTMAVFTYTSSATKAQSRQTPSQSGLFLPVSRGGLTLPTQGTAISEEDGLIRRRCEGSLDAHRAARPGLAQAKKSAVFGLVPFRKFQFTSRPFCTNRIRRSRCACSKRN